MKISFAFILTFLSLHVMAQSEDAQRRRNFNLTDNGVAAREFDVVSYFKGKPAKGIDKFEVTHKGIDYYFVSAENMEEFKKSPQKYEPAYGGWDAFSMATDGKRVKVDPSTFKIVDGKLYLFHNFNGKNHLLGWNKNEGKLKTSGDNFWLKTIR
ncbi:YHS domain-containing (seleno)protein [Pseudochryseolinea flava]|uniref:YHS domain protein n=1 Tax=Pseudochryseolinea flava TaxID=2059302 RepID=A0A364Y2M6_9BACT|nr:YHS domain-containing (seleno)protein [Pseudochryseolinea flava]RAW00357.1 YHS domain protein [Pseudochryseolinea flava]